MMLMYVTWNEILISDTPSRKIVQHNRLMPQKEFLISKEKKTKKNWRYFTQNRWLNLTRLFDFTRVTHSPYY